MRILMRCPDSADPLLNREFVGLPDDFVRMSLGTLLFRRLSLSVHMRNAAFHEVVRRAFPFIFPVEFTLASFQPLHAVPAARLCRSVFPPVRPYRCCSVA